MVRRLLGVVMLLIGLGGIVLAIFGARMGYRLVDRIATNFDETLQLTSQSLDTVLETLALAKRSIADVNTVMDTAESTADDLAQTVTDTRPLLGQISDVASTQVPDSLETIQQAFPSLEQVAGVIDSTLTTLNNFRIDENILGLNLQYDLGVDYAPEVPFDQSVKELGEGLEGLPESLRTLEIYINVANNNLQTVSQDIRNLADDLSTVNGRINELDPILDEYLRLITTTNDRTRQLRAQISDEAQSAKNGITLAMVWLAITQVAPLYLGWELVTNRRGVATNAVS